MGRCSFRFGIFPSERRLGAWLDRAVRLGFARLRKRRYHAAAEAKIAPNSVPLVMACVIAMGYCAFRSSVLMSGAPGAPSATNWPFGRPENWTVYESARKPAAAIDTSAP